MDERAEIIAMDTPIGTGSGLLGATGMADRVDLTRLARICKSNVISDRWFSATHLRCQITMFLQN